jgi:hypothetical protein
VFKMRATFLLLHSLSFSPVFVLFCFVILFRRLCCCFVVVSLLVFLPYYVHPLTTLALSLHRHPLLSLNYLITTPSHPSSLHTVAVVGGCCCCCCRCGWLRDPKAVPEGVALLLPRACGVVKRRLERGGGVWRGAEGMKGVWKGG